MHTFLEVHTQIEAADSTPCEILKPNFITISQGVEPAASICVCTPKNVCTLWAILKPNFVTIVVWGNNGDNQYIIMCIKTLTLTIFLEGLITPHINETKWLIREK